MICTHAKALSWQDGQWCPDCGAFFPEDSVDIRPREWNIPKAELLTPIEKELITAFRSVPARHSALLEKAGLVFINTDRPDLHTIAWGDVLYFALKNYADSLEK